MNETTINPLVKKKITLGKDSVCFICKKPLIKENNTLDRPIMLHEAMGPVHDCCFMPYHSQEQLKILFQIRCYSMGDTIATTPALRELRRLYPKAHITVMSFYPEIFKYNPHVDTVLDLNHPIPQKTVEAHHFRVDGFNSEGTHHFAVHSSEFGFMSSFNRSGMPNQWNYELYYTKKEKESMRKIVSESGIDLDNDKLILINPHKTEWSTRDWGKTHANDLVRKLILAYPDHKIVSVGGSRKEVPKQKIENYVELTAPHVDLYEKMGILESLAFFDESACKLLITPDTGAMHLGACADELRIVGVFTLIKAHLRTPVRKGSFGYKFIGIEAESGCNCTYDAKVLTHQSYFGTCPKKTFLEETLGRDLPKHVKIEGLINYDPSRKWGLESINKEIEDELKKYDPDNLPCFPGVDRVFEACEHLLHRPKLKVINGGQNA